MCPLRGQPPARVAGLAGPRRAPENQPDGQGGCCQRTDPGVSQVPNGVGVCHTCLGVDKYVYIVKICIYIYIYIYVFFFFFFFFKYIYIYIYICVYTNYIYIYVYICLYILIYAFVCIGLSFNKGALAFPMGKPLCK